MWNIAFLTVNVLVYKKFNNNIKVNIPNISTQARKHVGNPLFQSVFDGEHWMIIKSSTHTFGLPIDYYCILIIRFLG